MLKDPIGANLDRIQIIKGWLDVKVCWQERIYDVVCGDAEKRQAGADGKYRRLVALWMSLNAT